MNFHFLKKLKAATTVAISVMLAFPPQIFAADIVAKTRIDLIEKKLVESGLTKGGVRVQDFMNANLENIPVFARNWIREGLAVDPDATMPQFSVRRVKVNNKKELQVSYVDDGQSAVVNFIDEGFYFMKVGNQKISVQEFLQGPSAMAKIEEGLPNLKGADGWRPHFNQASFPKPVLLKFDQLKKLSQGERKTYLQNYRELLAQLEKLQGTLTYEAPIKVSQNWFFDVLVPKLNAQYRPPADTPCIVAGYDSNIGRRTDGKGSCGVTTSGRPLPKIAEAIKACSDKGLSGKIECNPVLYGAGTCVDLNKDSSAACNQNADVLKAYLYTFNEDSIKGKTADQVKADYEKSLTETENALRIASGSCPASSPGYNEPKGKLTSAQKILKADQEKTCKEIEKRIADLRSISCSDSQMKTGTKGTESFKTGDTYLASLCKEPVPPVVAPPPSNPPVVVTPPPGPQCPIPTPVTDATKPPTVPVDIACKPEVTNACFEFLKLASQKGYGLTLVNPQTAALFNQKFASSEFEIFKKPIKAEKGCNYDIELVNNELKQAAQQACDTGSAGNPIYLSRCMNCQNFKVDYSTGKAACVAEAKTDSKDKYAKEKRKKKGGGFWSGLWPWLLGLGAVAGAFWIGNKFFKAAVKKNEELNAPTPTTLPPATPLPTNTTLRNRTAPLVPGVN